MSHPAPKTPPLPAPDGFWRRKVVRPLLDLLKHGVTPDKLALSIAVGATLAVFPALGTTTVLCALAALAFGLNLPAIQLVNYLAYPLQLILIIPFFRLGEALFRDHSTHLTFPLLTAAIKTGIWHAIVTLWTASWHAMIAWAIIAPLAGAFLFLVLRILLRRAAAALATRAQAARIGA